MKKESGIEKDEKKMLPKNKESAVSVESLLLVNQEGKSLRSLLGNSIFIILAFVFMVRNCLG